MKPKKKSNAVITVLLFLFVIFPDLGLSSDFAASCISRIYSPSDTIIIDGETIFIEKEYIPTNMDSLREANQADIKLRPIPLHLFNVALHVGMNITSATFGTSLSDFTPLNNFVDNKVSVQRNLTSSIDMSARIWRFPAMNGQVDLELHSGIGLNKVKINVNSFDVDSLLRDSLILLRYNDNELYLEYFKIFPPGPFGELDTAIIPIMSNQIKYATIDVPIKLHTAWTAQKSLWTVFVEAGIVKRFVVQSSRSAFDNYLVNKSGAFLKLPESDFNTKNLIRPVFGIGAEKKIESGIASTASYFSVGASANAVLPATAFNQSSLFYVDIMSYSLSAFMRFHF